MTKPYYVVNKYEDGSELAWAHEYDMLRGPDGFECLLTEPEDRNWYRDGRDVVAELNRLYEENQQLVKSLRDIVDPLGYLRSRLKKDEKLNGMRANALIQDAVWYQERARLALAAAGHKEREPDDCG